jgi:hypothetical protein
MPPGTGMPMPGVGFIRWYVPFCGSTSLPVVVEAGLPATSGARTALSAGAGSDAAGAAAGVVADAAGAATSAARTPVGAASSASANPAAFKRSITFEPLLAARAVLPNVIVSVLPLFSCGARSQPLARLPDLRGLRPPSPGLYARLRAVSSASRGYF